MSQCPATPGVTILPLCSPGPRLSSGSQCLHSREHAPPTLGLNPVLKGLALRLSTRAPGGSSLLARAGPHCRRRRHRRQSHGLFLTIWSPLLGCPLRYRKVYMDHLHLQASPNQGAGLEGNTPPRPTGDTILSGASPARAQETSRMDEWMGRWMDG